jgi:hypothetical protein
MPQRREVGRPVIICPHCGSNLSDRVLIIYPPHPRPDFSGPSVWQLPKVRGRMAARAFHEGREITSRHVRGATSRCRRPPYGM